MAGQRGLSMRSNVVMHRGILLARRLVGGLAVGTLAVAPPAHAGELYGNAGLPGVMLGYAFPAGDRVTLRADVSSLGSIETDGRKDGMDYRAKVLLNRVGMFGDWFAFDPGGFRLTSGVTFNGMHGTMAARGNGQLVTVGNHSYLLTPADRIDVRIQFPRVTPYLGIGWGHQPAGDPGWGFVFDLGASIGKANVTGQASGPVLSSPAAQEDFQRELEDLRDKADRVRFVPQLSMGLNYRF